MTVVILPGGQYAEKGMAIDFPVPIEKNIDILPRKFSESNIITVSYDENMKKKPTHLIRPKRIFKALKWMKENNEAYENITINFDDFDTHRIENEESDIPMVEECSAIPIDNVLPDLKIEQVANYIVWLRITDEGSIPEMRIWSILLIKSESKWCIYLSRSLFLNCNSTKHFKLRKCEGNPLNAYELLKGEEVAFPYLFPLGKNGFKFNRTKNLNTFMYFRHRLKYFDRRFRKNITYLLHAVNHYEFLRLSNSVGIHMRMRKTTNTDTHSEITGKDLKNIKQNPDILENSYMFMKNIKGTAAYWKNTLLNLLAMFKTLGPPSLFVTLSANDMHWPELIMTMDHCTYEEASSHKNAFKLVKQDPYMTAIHFQRRFKALFKYIINRKSSPLGKVVDHFVRVEFQNRGSPHYHMFFWIENFINIFSNQENLIENIHKTISTNIPNDDSDLALMVKKFQTHCHTEYCLRKLGRCRFGFPQRLCSKTHLLSNVNLTSESQRGKFYETVRNVGDTYINAYNKIILKHWQANMDIQIIGNAESAAYYVCAYLCKSEPEDLKIALFGRYIFNTI